MTITRLNPENLHKNPAFAQVAVVEASARMIYIGGQNAVNQAGDVVGQDIVAQTTQTMKNLIAALGAAGASWQDVFKMTIYVVQGQPIHEGFEAFQRLMNGNSYLPTVSVVIVVGLANPEFLIEIDAVAAT